MWCDRETTNMDKRMFQTSIHQKMLEQVSILPQLTLNVLSYSNYIFMVIGKLRVLLGVDLYGVGWRVTY